MRKILLGLAISCLSACQSSLDNPPPMRPQAGAYQGDHGEITQSMGLESELVLDSNGTFRYFFIDSNTAVITAKGRWTASSEEMVATGVSRSRIYHGGFSRWDTLGNPDTSYLRKVTDSSFERLESTYDTLFNPVLRWVSYRRFFPEKLLPEGAFDFSETYGIMDTLTVAGLTRLKATRNGAFTQQIFRDGVLYMSDVDSVWTQAGTYLITSGNRHCDYDQDGTYCGNAIAGYEYVARLSAVGDSSFRLWMAPDFTFQPGPFWADFHKVSLPGTGKRTQ